MATIFNKNWASLLDLIKAEEFDGATEMMMGELLEADALFKAMPFFTTSDGMKHKDIKATSLGSGDFVSANSGTGTTSSNVETVENNVCYYSVLSQIDEVVLKAGKKEQARKLRAEQNELNLAGFKQGFINKLFYGNTVDDPAGLNGLATRRNDLSSKYVFNAGQTTGNATSMYLMEFGKAAVNMRHQEGKSGFVVQDLGKNRYKLDNGKFISLWEMQYDLWALLDVFDERSLIRYANINPDGSSNGLDSDDFIKMKNLLPNVGKGASGFVNRSLLTQAEILMANKDNVLYTRGEIENFGPIVKFMGIPLLLQDCIKDNETIVS